MKNTGLCICGALKYSEKYGPFRISITHSSSRDDDARLLGRLRNLRNPTSRLADSIPRAKLRYRRTPSSVRSIGCVVRRTPYKVLRTLVLVPPVAGQFIYSPRRRARRSRILRLLPSSSSNINIFTSNMSNIASSSLLQTSRICLKRSAPSACLARGSAAYVTRLSSQRRGYVSETKKGNAQVSVDTAIRAEQNKFFKETGKRPESEIVPGTSVNADAMMSPIAG